jgi:hypothetical protein
MKRACSSSQWLVETDAIFGCHLWVGKVDKDRYPVICPQRTSRRCGGQLGRNTTMKNIYDAAESLIKRLSFGAQECLKATGTDLDQVVQDILRVKKGGEKEASNLLRDCLKGAEGWEVKAAWREYCAAISFEAEVRS